MRHYATRRQFVTPSLIKYDKILRCRLSTKYMSSSKKSKEILADYACIGPPQMIAWMSQTQSQTLAAECSDHARIMHFPNQPIYDFLLLLSRAVLVLQKYCREIEQFKIIYNVQVLVLAIAVILT